MALVYLATSPSGKTYVGWTSRTLGERRREHEKLAKRGGELPIHRAIRQYSDQLVWTVLEDDLAEHVAPCKERHYIQLFGSFSRGYNCTAGGEGVQGYKHSAKTRAKLSASLRALGELHPSRTPEGRARTSARLLALGPNHPSKTPEARARMSRQALALGERHAMKDPVKRTNHHAKRPEERERISKRQRRLNPAQITNVLLMASLGAYGTEIAKWFDVEKSTAQKLIRGSANTPLPSRNAGKGISQCPLQKRLTHVC